MWCVLGVCKRFYKLRHNSGTMQHSPAPTGGLPKSGPTGRQRQGEKILSSQTHPIHLQPCTLPEGCHALNSDGEERRGEQRPITGEAPVRGLAFPLNVNYPARSPSWNIPDANSPGTYEKATPALVLIKRTSGNVQHQKKTIDWVSRDSCKVVHTYNP